MRSRGVAVRQFGLALAAALVLGGAGRAAGTETAAFLDANEGRYRQALGRARAWIEALEVNPVALRRHGIKGKKKVAEWLDAALRLYEASGLSEQADLRARIERLRSRRRRCRRRRHRGYRRLERLRQLVLLDVERRLPAQWTLSVRRGRQNSARGRL